MKAATIINPIAINIGMNRPCTAQWNMVRTIILRRAL
jgi:hypothetical protein